VFTDPVSNTNLTWGEIEIGRSQAGYRTCFVRWEAAGNLLYLRDDTDSSWLGPAAAGASGAVQNNQCVPDFAHASVSRAGASATLTLPISFKNFSAGGTMNVYMSAQSAATASAWQQRGTWTVAFAFQPLSVTPNAGSGFAQTFTFRLAGLYSYNNPIGNDELNVGLTTSTIFGTLEIFRQKDPDRYEKVGTQPTGFGAQTGFFSPAFGETLRCHEAPAGRSGRGNPRLRYEIGAANGVADYGRLARLTSRHVSRRRRTTATPAW
jgi:hypothetical protein